MTRNAKYLVAIVNNRLLNPFGKEKPVGGRSRSSILVICHTYISACSFVELPVFRTDSLIKDRGLLSVLAGCGSHLGSVCSKQTLSDR